MNEHAAKP
jgi:hypothetical protein